MYRTLVLDPGLRDKLGPLTDQLEVRDEGGQVVGVYLPLDMYKYFLRNIKLPFSEAELRQLKQDKGSSTLSEVWEGLGAK